MVLSIDVEVLFLKGAIRAVRRGVGAFENVLFGRYYYSTSVSGRRRRELFLVGVWG